MVQIKIAAVSFLLVAPSIILALPLQSLDERSQDLAVREPVTFENDVAGMFTREDPSQINIDARDLADMIQAFQDISKRDLELMDELAAREPKFGFFKKIKHAFKKVAKVGKAAFGIAKHFIREDSEDEELFARSALEDIDARDLADIVLAFADISERDLELMDELAAREPKFGFFKKIKHAFKKVAKVGKAAFGIAKHFIREDSEDSGLLGREALFEIDDLSTRDFEEMEEFFAREEADSVEDLMARDYELLD